MVVVRGQMWDHIRAAWTVDEKVADLESDLVAMKVPALAAAMAVWSGTD